MKREARQDIAIVNLRVFNAFGFNTIPYEIVDIIIELTEDSNAIQKTVIENNIKACNEEKRRIEKEQHRIFLHGLNHCDAENSSNYEWDEEDLVQPKRDRQTDFFTQKSKRKLFITNSGKIHHKK